MKKEIHPTYQPTVFLDTQSGFKFLTRSTVQPKETIEWEDGKTYPVVKVEISAASHPHYTGKKIFVDTGGRVERFRKKYATQETKSTPKKPTTAKKATKSKGPAKAKASTKT